MQSGTAHNGGVQLAYETFGKPAGRPLLLVNGLDGQMIGWPEGFCTALADAGFQVVRFDLRDQGLSTHFSGKRRAYTVTEMIDDMMAVLDANEWPSANLAGISMGGGLAQFAALLQPDRIRTLTLISAVPQYGNPILLFRYIRFPGPFRLAFRRYGSSPQEQAQMLADVTRLGAARSMPLDEDWVRAVAAESVRRHSPDPAARSRQLAAGRGARLPRGGIAGIRQPVLALNGDEDPLVRAAAGAKIAELVQNGRFVLVHRMGHLFSPPLWPELVGEIDRHAL